MKYKFTVPPTRDVGSYSGVCSASYSETYRQNALWDYNSCRAHDGLPPLDKMPRGTRYTPIRATDKMRNALKLAEATILRLANTPARVASVQGTRDVIKAALA